MDDLGIYIQAILKLDDIEKNKKQIISDLPKLEAALQSEDKAKINIIAGIDIDKSKKLIQSQISEITKEINLSDIKVGVDIGNNNSNNVHLKPEIKPILDRSVYVELEDYIDEISKQISNLEIVDADTLAKRIKRSFGNCNAELKDDIAQFVNALKLSPNDQSTVVSTYIDVIESIRDTFTVQGVYKAKDIEKNIADEIFRCATNIESVQNQTSKSSQKIVLDLKEIKKQATQTANATNFTFGNNRFNNQSEDYIHSQYQIQTAFKDTTDVVAKAEQYFSRFGDVAVDSIEKLSSEGELKRFIVNVKSATGEIEKFHYALTDIGTENSPDFVFKLTNIDAANAGVQKLKDSIEVTKTKYSYLLANFKNVNSGILSGLTEPLNDFETKLKNLGKTSSISNVKNSFTSLKEEASKITSYLTSTDKSLNKATNAINNYKNMDNILKEMSISFDNLIIKPDGLENELNGLKTKLIELQELEKSEGGYTEDWAKKYHEVNLELAKVKTNIDIVAKAESSSRDADKNSEYQIQLKYLDRIKKDTNTIISYKKQLVSAGDETAAVYKNEISKAKKRIDYDVKQLEKKKLLTNEAKSLVNTYARQIELQDELTSAKLRDSANNQAVKQSIADIKTYADYVEETIKLLKKLDTSQAFKNNSANDKVKYSKQEISSILAEYQELYTQLQNNPTGLDMTKLTSELTELDNRVKPTIKSISDFEAQLSNSDGAEKLALRIKVLREQMQTWENANPKAAKYYKNEFQNLYNMLDTSPDLSGLNEVAKKFRVIKYEAAQADKTGNTLFGTLKEKSKKFLGWMSMTWATTTFFQNLKEMVNNVVELDSAMTNLKKVTDETKGTYNSFLTQTKKQAQELHSTITDLIEQTSVWAKLGYDLEKSSQLSEASMIYANVGEVDNEQAVTNIVSAMKAFDIAVDDVMSIPDVYNKLGNEFAVSSANLGTGMTQAATTMAMAGNSFEQVAALLTGAGEILGDNKLDEIGNGMKTVTLRIQNQAGALQELGEEYEDLVSVSKTQQQIYELTNGTVNIMSDTDPNTFRSTYDILKDVSEVITDLNDTQASELIQLLFGKNRANVGTAVLKAFQSGQIEKAYNAALNSSGSAQKEFDAWCESIEARINNFKAAFESLSETVVNSDLIKIVIDSGTTILNILDGIIDNVGSLSVAITGVATVLSFKDVGFFGTNEDDVNKLSKKLTFLKRSFSDIATDFKNKQGIQSLFNLINTEDIENLNKFSQELNQGADYTSVFNKYLSSSHTYVQKQAEKIKILCDEQKNLKNQLNIGNITQEQYQELLCANEGNLRSVITNTNQLTFAQRAATITTEALSVAFKTLLNIGVSFAINFIVNVITNAIKKEEELRDKAVETVNTIENEAKALKDLKQEYIDLCDSEDDKLAKQEQLNEIKQELINVYGIEKDKLSELNLEREEGIALLEKEIALKEKNERNIWLAENADTIGKAERKISGLTASSKEDGWITLETFWSKFSLDDIRDEIKGSFDDYYSNSQNVHFSVGGFDLIEKYENLQNIIALLGDMSDLTEAEKKLRDNLVEESKNIKTQLEDNNYQEIFETANKYKAKNLFDDYVSNNHIEDVSKETFKSWQNGLLKIANDNVYLKKELEAIISETFPDLSEYFDNLDKAYNMFGIDDIVNSASEGLKKAFINGLSEDELKIATQIPNLFQDGLDKAKEKIDSFNKSTTISTTVDKTSALDLVENTSNEISVIKSIMEDLTNTGYITSSTYADITELGGNFTDCLEVQNGKLVVNREKLKELEEQQLRTAKSTNSLAISELELKAASLAAHGQDFSAISDEIKTLMDENAVYTTLLSEIENAFDINNYIDDDDDDDEPAIITEFKNALAKKEHLLAMNQISEQDYYEWLDSESKKVYSDLTDYQEDLWKYEEQIYQWRTEKEQELFDKKIENYEKLSDKALEDYVNDKGNDISVIDSFEFARKQINSAIVETQNRIAKLSSQTGFEDEVEILVNNLESLYDKLDDINKSEIESQIDYINNLKDEYSDLMDSKIDAIDEQIDSIKKVSEAEEKQKNILEAELEVQKAQRDLEKARIKNRLVYTGNGNWELREDTEAVAEAQETLNEKQESLQETKDEQAISLLEEQKEILETQKENGEKQYDILSNIYEKLNGEKSQTENNTNLISKLTDNGDIQRAVQSLTPTEIKEAFENAILTVDKNGKYALNQDILNAKTQQNNTNLTDFNSKIDNNSEGKYSGYRTFNELVDAIIGGTFNILPNSANEIMNNNIRNNVSSGGLSDEKSASNNIANAPVFNLTMNVSGSVDDSFVPTVRTEVNNMLLEYTQYFGQQYSQEILRRQSK